MATVKDKGLIIFDTDSGTFFAGLNAWKKEVRHAQIYHSEKYIKEAMETACEKHPNMKLENLVICDVEIKATIPEKIK